MNKTVTTRLHERIRELEGQREALVAALERIKETRVFVGAIPLQMADAALARVKRNP